MSGIKYTEELKIRIAEGYFGGGSRVIMPIKNSGTTIRNGRGKEKNSTERTQRNRQVLYCA